mmetsp:Transcript_11031/g.35107  ORF Transcript_11031/g.35107 Transcript_11031/m.35107 type:complete len:280 (+) Transcript_11031:1034-1873(+)
MANERPVGLSLALATLLELTIEPAEATHDEDGVVRFLLDAAAPLPRGRESAIHTAPCVEEVVCAGAVECVAEEVAQHHLAQLLHTAKLGLHVAVQLWVSSAQRADLLQHLDDGLQDALHLRVLVDEDQRVWNVVVPEVDDRAADPVVRLGMHAAQDAMHRVTHQRRPLLTIEALACVCEAIHVPRRQDVQLGHEPELVEIVDDVAPQDEGLVDVQVLPRMAVREPRAAVAGRDGQREALLGGVGVEGGAQVVEHFVDGVTVGRVERVVVRDGVQAVLDL